MTRHGRNATASSVYTYHEKKKDTAASGYGSKTVRLGKDSIKDFDCCCLTLQPCRNPIITPDGYLYDKEAILECLLHQKREIADLVPRPSLTAFFAAVEKSVSSLAVRKAVREGLDARKMKEYEKQRTKHQSELEELGKAEARSRVEKFLSTETSIVSKPVDAFGRSQEKKEVPSVSNMAASAGEGKGRQSGAEAGPSGSGERRPKLPSFWVPSLTPAAKATEIKKPDMKTFCPMSGKSLKVKDLITVKFTPIADRDHKTATIVKQARYMCPVTHDALGNSIPCAVLKPTGDVVTMECVDKLIRKSEMLCPISGQKLKESDIVAVVRGGTGFAASGVSLKATKAGAAMMV